MSWRCSSFHRSPPHALAILRPDAYAVRSSANLCSLVRLRLARAKVIFHFTLPNLNSADRFLHCFWQAFGRCQRPLSSAAFPQATHHRAILTARNKGRATAQSEQKTRGKKSPLRTTVIAVASQKRRTWAHCISARSQSRH